MNTGTDPGKWKVVQGLKPKISKCDDISVVLQEIWTAVENACNGTVRVVAGAMPQYMLDHGGALPDRAKDSLS